MSADSGDVVYWSAPMPDGPTVRAHQHMVYGSGDPVASMQFACGCRIEVRPGDPPIKAFECEHGTSVRGVDPPTGQEVYEYEKWLREHCSTCGKLRSEPEPAGCRGCVQNTDLENTDLVFEYGGTIVSPSWLINPAPGASEEQP